MKIAITGSTNGIGLALNEVYQKRGHDIVPIATRLGDDIRDIGQTVNKIKSCDMFINNAQQDYAQADLTFAMHKEWNGVEGKHIISISTMSTLMHDVSYEQLHYVNQKHALENAMINLAQTAMWPQMILVKPGEVNTGEHSGPLAGDPKVWAEKLVSILELAGPEFKVYELSLGVDYTN